MDADALNQKWGGFLRDTNEDHMHELDVFMMTYVLDRVQKSTMDDLLAQAEAKGFELSPLHAEFALDVITSDHLRLQLMLSEVPEEYYSDGE